MTDVSAHSVLSVVTAHWGARCAHVLAEAGIPDLLGDRPETPEMLAAAAGVDPEALDRIMRLVVSLGIFVATPEGYAHNEASRLLRSDHPRSLRPYARMIGSDWQWRSIGALGHALRTGQTGMSHVFGKESFDYLGEHPDLSQVFDAAMQSRSTLDMPGILAAGDFSRFPVIADIGGGNGALLRAVLQQAPESTGILFDLPSVIAASAPRDVPRLTAVGGSFFTDPLPRADAYLLRRVIHDWRDAEALAILTAVRAAAAPGASLILLETPLPEGPERHQVKGLDIVMLAVVGGKERTLDQYRSLMDSAGFVFAGATATPTGLALIEGVAR